MKPIRFREREEGAAAVELALLSLVLVPTLFYAIYMYDLSLARLRANEINRYAVWEMTAMPLSDYGTANHDARFASARQAVISEVQSRYGDDLDGSSPMYTGGVKANFSAISKMTLMMPQGGCPNLENQEEPWLKGGFTLSRYIIDKARFNTRGRTQSMIGVQVDPVVGTNMLTLQGPQELMPKKGGGGGGCFPSWPPVPSAVAGLVVDTWDLKDGKKVAEVEGENCDSDYCKQVARMAYHVPLIGQGGMKITGEAMRVAGWTTLGFYRNPTNVVLHSYPVSGSQTSERQVEAPWGVRKYYTNAYKEIMHDTRSIYRAIGKKLGPNYMGCKQEEMQEGQCRYQ